MKRQILIAGLGLALAVAGAPVVTLPAFAQIPTPQTYGDAMRWYERAARAGNAKAQYFLGIMAEEGVHGAPDPAKAVMWYRKAAENGYAEAQYRLAHMLLRGEGVAADAKRAAHWFEAAADQGISEAQYNLGLMLEQGIGVQADPARAADLYRRAAMTGIGQACYRLSFLYAQGIGVERDLVEALAWLDLAGDGSQVGYESYRRSLTDEMTPAQIDAARKLADKRKKAVGKS